MTSSMVCRRQVLLYSRDKIRDLSHSFCEDKGSILLFTCQPGQFFLFLPSWPCFNHGSSYCVSLFANKEESSNSAVD